MPKKKNITIIIISISLILIIILGIMGYLYLKTDAFKSNDKLFYKYLAENSEMVDILKPDENNLLDEMSSKTYTSEISGKMEYIENVETSEENKSSGVNNILLKINREVDNPNNYSYSKIILQTPEKNVLAGIEYIFDNSVSAYRLNGVKEFVTNGTDESIQNETGDTDDQKSKNNTENNTNQTNSQNNTNSVEGNGNTTNNQNDTENDNNTSNNQNDTENNDNASNNQNDTENNDNTTNNQNNTENNEDETNNQNDVNKTNSSTKDNKSTNQSKNNNTTSNSSAKSENSTLDDDEYDFSDDNSFFDTRKIKKAFDDIDKIVTFTDDEKSKLENRYTKIIQDSIPKNNYNKEKNKTIKIDDKAYTANAYSVTLTFEQYNNTNIKILEQLKKDDIILAKINSFETFTINKSLGNLKNGDLQNKFTSKIDTMIKQIQDNNIGNDEVKITVYEQNMKTICTEIEEKDFSYKIVLLNNSTIEINATDNKKSTIDNIKFQKNTNNGTNSLSFDFTKIKQDKTVYDFKLNYSKMDNSQGNDNTMTCDVKNEKNSLSVTLTDNIKLVDKLEKSEENPTIVDLSKYSEERQNRMSAILESFKKDMVDNISAVASLEEYQNLLESMSISQKENIQMTDENELSDTAKDRFNSQFEFFVSSDLSKEKIDELLSATKNNFKDMKVKLTTGKEEDLDFNKFQSTGREGSDYRKTIASLIIKIKENTSNSEKYEQTQKYFEKLSNSKFTVSVSKDDNGIINEIFIKEQN